MVGVRVIASKIKNLSKFMLGLGATFIIICIVFAGALIYSNSHISKSAKAAQAKQEKNLADEALLRGDNAQALIDAKKALADQPNNVTNIQLVANITNFKNPGLAKQYYTQALNKFKQQNGLGSNDTNAVNYWFAARLAQAAGEISQAKQYYQDVIKTANPSNSYEQSLAKQAPVDIKDLQ